MQDKEQYLPAHKTEARALSNARIVVILLSAWVSICKKQPKREAGRRKVKVVKLQLVALVWFGLVWFVYFPTVAVGNQIASVERDWPMK